MYVFRSELWIAASFIVELADDAASARRRFGGALNAETVAAAAYQHAETGFNLAQMLVVRPAQRSQAPCVVGFEDEVEYVWRVQ